MHIYFVYCMKLILKEFMLKQYCNIEKYQNNCQIKPNNYGP